MITRNFTSFTLALIAAQFATTALKADYYPVGCFYSNGEQAYPMVAVADEQAWVQKEEELIPIAFDELRLERLELYGEGYVEVIKDSAYTFNSALRSVNSAGPGNRIPNRGFIDITFRPSRPLEDGYAVVFSGTKAGMTAVDLDELFVTFHPLGKLKGGIEHKDTFPCLTLNSVTADRDQQYFIIFYDAGMPLRSSYDSAISDHFARREEARFQGSLEQYLKKYRDETRAHIPFNTFIPYLPRELYSRAGPIDSKVVFNIRPDGRTEVESISGITDAEVLRFLTARIEEWRFLPRLLDGTPVASRTATRVQF